MKKLLTSIAISVATFTVGCALGASTTMPKQMSQSTIQKALSTTSSKDLLYACVTTKSNHQICGYFTRQALLQSNKAAKGDVYMIFANGNSIKVINS